MLSARQRLDSTTHDYYPLSRLAEAGFGDPARLPMTVKILLENFAEDEISDTSEESRRWQRHHPGQDHVANRRPAHTVQAFEKADSNYR